MRRSDEDLFTATIFPDHYFLFDQNLAQWVVARIAILNVQIGVNGSSWVQS